MPADRLPELQQYTGRYTAGRFLQALAVAKGITKADVGFHEAEKLWLDRGQVVAAIKAGTPATTSGQLPPELIAVADSFIAAMRTYSVPLRLEGLRKIPMNVRFYINAHAVTADEVDDSRPIPIFRSDWTYGQLRPRKFAGITVQTNEIMQSPSPIATLAIVDDLAKATAAAENDAFLRPDIVGSVLHDAYTFSATGAGLADVDADLRRLVDLVPGAFYPGAAFTMAQETATFLSLLRGSGGAAAYPSVTPQGGTLVGLPVLVTSACQTGDSPGSRFIGLLSPSEILWADEGRAILTVSSNAALEMSDSPIGGSLMPPPDIVSLFQSESTATKALRESAWAARSGSGAYFTTYDY